MWSLVSGVFKYRCSRSGDWDRWQRGKKHNIIIMLLEMQNVKGMYNVLFLRHRYWYK